mgnify:CR=1 FL=1
MKSLLTTILIVLLTVPCFGADSTNATIPPVQASVLPETDVFGTYGLLARMVFSLFVVLVLIWGAVQILQRVSKTSANKGSSHIRVLDRAHLAPKRAIYVVQIGSQPLALGVTDNQITTLAELDAEEIRAAYPDQEPRIGTQSFAHLFNHIRSRWETKQA